MKSLTNTKRALVAAGLAAGTAAALAPGASAYSGATPACGGTPIVGMGASLQSQGQYVLGAELLRFPTTYVYGTDKAGNQAVATANPNSKGFGTSAYPNVPSQCAGIANASTDLIKYVPSGSGGGRRAFGSDAVTTRDETVDFVGTDEAPADGSDPAPNNINEISNIENFGLATPHTFETIPVAQASIALIVNLPAGCQLLRTQSRTALVEPVERALWGESNVTWGTVLGTSNVSCPNAPITRVVRQDSSGSSFALKNILESVNSRWAPFTTVAQNKVWPNDAAPTAVVRPTGTGGSNLASKVQTTEGGLGYVDLATARKFDFDYAGGTDRTFWLRLNVPSGSSRITIDPAKDGTDGTKIFGAQCGDNRVYNNVPASTQSPNSWYQVTGAQTTYRSDEYPICTLTYALAYNNYNGIPGATEPSTRMVFDYLKYVTDTNGGQKLLRAGDYYPLPTSLRQKAIDGVNRIDWIQ